MLLWVCSVIDHRRRQNVVRTSVTHSAIASCATFLFLPHFDVICDLLLNRRTATWNLFVNYIGKICSKAFYGLYKIRQIRKFLNPESTKTLVHAFVTSHLDYCNSLLFGVPKYQIDRLRKVLNAAARFIFRIPKFDHISPALFHLHWLPVAYRVHFKLLLLVYKSLNNQGPQYIQEYLQPYSVTGHHLRSCDQGLLKIPRTNFKTFGDRAFARSGPFVWNKLPREIRNSQSVVIFKSKLKKHLFKLAYNLF